MIEIVRFFQDNEARLQNIYDSDVFSEIKKECELKGFDPTTILWLLHQIKLRKDIGRKGIKDLNSCIVDVFNDDSWPKY